jgi:protein-disulfide isomerase
MFMLKALRRALVACALLSAPPTFAAALTPEQKAEVEQTIREYLLKNPELLLQVMEELEAKQKEAAVSEAREGMQRHRAALLDSPHDFVLNPKGKVPIVEFFDYQCGYCKQVAPTLRQVMADRDVRFIYKEIPILGEPSAIAAKAAIAARRQGKYVELHNALMAHRGRLSEDVVMTLARDAGLDMKQLKADMERPEVDAAIDANLQLARALGIRGTPTIIVGDALVPGAIEPAQLRELVDAARKDCRIC